MATRLFSRHEVELLLDVDREFLLALEREEIVVCEQGNCYSVKALERIRVCHTIHYDLGVNFAGLEVALNLLETIESERRQFRSALDWLQEQSRLRGKER